MRLVLGFWVVLLAATAVECKPKAKSNPEAGPWDWQNDASISSYPVFSPYPLSKFNQPEFLKLNRNITVMVGETAFLPCRVKNLDQYTVSWIKASDVTVLSVGHLAFSSDARISVVQVPRPRLSAADWNLSIKNASLADDGMYECQVNTDPKINYKVFLKVTDPTKSLQADSPYYQVDDHAAANGFEQTHSVIKKHHKQVDKAGFSMFLHDNGCLCPNQQFNKDKLVEIKEKQKEEVLDPEMSIPGGSVQYVTSGDGFQLECLVSALSKAPSSLYWEKRNKVLTAKERTGVSLETEKLAGVSRISLYIGSAVLSDTGNYTCVSDMAKTETVLLVVTGEEEKPLFLASTKLSSGGDSLISSFTVLAFTVIAVIKSLQ